MFVTVYFKVVSKLHAEVFQVIKMEIIIAHTTFKMENYLLEIIYLRNRYRKVYK